MAQQRNYLFLGIFYARNVKGISSTLAYCILHSNCFKGVFSLWLYGPFYYTAAELLLELSCPSPIVLFPKTIFKTHHCWVLLHENVLEH
jgi:hypothetical protein